MLSLLKHVFTFVYTIMILPELETFILLTSDAFSPIKGIKTDLISMFLVSVSLDLSVLVLSWLEQHVHHHEVLLYRLKHLSNCTCGTSVFRL